MATERRSTPERAAPVVTADAVARQQEIQRQQAEAKVEAEAAGEQPLDEIHFDEGQGYLVNDVLVDANGNPIDKTEQPEAEARTETR